MLQSVGRLPPSPYPPVELTTTTHHTPKAEMERAREEVRTLACTVARLAEEVCGMEWVDGCMHVWGKHVRERRGGVWIRRTGLPPLLPLSSSKGAP